MNDADEWSRLQDAWGGDTQAAMPDVAPMIARARRERRSMVWTIAGECLITVVSVAIVIENWPRLRADGLLGLWWALILVVGGVGSVGTFAIRIAGLREPTGASLRDWLLLRRRRARLGLRLAQLTRWTLVVLLPAPLVTATTARSAAAAAWGVAAMLLLLGGGWWWARRKTARMTTDIAEVDALALEWLDQPLTA